MALYEQEGLVRRARALFPEPADADIELLAPGAETRGHFSVTTPAGPFLRDWTLVLRPRDQDLLADAARQRRHAYALTGALMILTVLASRCSSPVPSSGNCA